MDSTDPSLNLGAIVDDFRPLAVQELDANISETVASVASVTLEEKTPDQWVKYPDRNQISSSTCVAQSMAKIDGILEQKKSGEFLVASATPIYKARSNKSEGMIGVEAFTISRDIGTVPETVVPSQNMTEAEIDAYVLPEYTNDLAVALRIGDSVGFTPKDFDTLVSTMVVTQKPVMVWFTFNSAEWSPLIPKTLITNPPYVHSVVATQACTYNGVRGIVIEDSAHFGGLTRRFVTEDFYKQRNVFARYPINLVNVLTQQPLAFDPTFLTSPTQLQYGDSNNYVRSLQDFLKKVGVFPTNVDSTGNYYGITASAVLKFCNKYGITPTSPTGKIFGTVEIAKAVFVINKP